MVAVAVAVAVGGAGSEVGVADCGVGVAEGVTLGRRVGVIARVGVAVGGMPVGPGVGEGSTKGVGLGNNAHPSAVTVSNAATAMRKPVDLERSIVTPLPWVRRWYL